MHTLTGTLRGAKEGRGDDAQESASPPPRGVVRSDKRIAGGVAAGLARHFNIDPIVPRIGFVLLAIFTGAGALLYALAWLALPSEDGPSRLQSAFGGEPRRGAVAVAGLALLAIGGALLVAGLPGLAGPELSVAVYLIGLGLGALWWRRGATRASGHPPSPPAEAAVSDQSAAIDQPAVAGPPPRTTTPIAAPSAGDRGGRSIAWATLGALGLLAGIMALVATQTDGIGVQTVLAGALIAVAGALVVSAYTGRLVGLATIGVVLALGVTLVATVGAPLQGGFGEATWMPSSSEELQDEYRLTAGDGILDLSAVDLPAGRHSVEASVAFGRLEIVVPDGVDLNIDGSVTAGEITVLDLTDDGFNKDLDVSINDDRDVQLDLTAEVGFGDLAIR